VREKPELVGNGFLLVGNNIFAFTLEPQALSARESFVGNPDCRVLRNFQAPLAGKK
jgi:hypothetical protein